MKILVFLLLLFGGQQMQQGIVGTNGTVPLPATSYANFGGTGDRTASIVVTNTVNLNTTVYWLINGAFSNTLFFGGQSLTGAEYIRFNFSTVRSGHAYITEAKWTQSGASAQGTWQWQGSNDGTTWTNIGSTFTLGSTNPQTMTTLNGNLSFYAYYQMLGVGSGTNNGPYLQQIEFKIGGF